MIKFKHFITLKYVCLSFLFFFFFLLGRVCFGGFDWGSGSSQHPPSPCNTTITSNSQSSDLFGVFPTKIQFNLHTLFLPVHSDDNAALVPVNKHPTRTCHTWFLDLSHLLNVCNRSLRYSLTKTAELMPWEQRGLVFGWAPMGLTATQREACWMHNTKREEIGAETRSMTSDYALLKVKA